MDIRNRNKLQKFLNAWTPGTIASSKWLRTFNIGRNLLQVYKNHQWLIPFNSGPAYKRPQDKIEWYGALYALQYQLGLHVYVGGKTALELQGHGHYIPLNRARIDLLVAPKCRIPHWFSHHVWEEDIRISQSNILPATVGLEELSMGNFPIKISSRERAALEILHLSPRFYNFEEVRLIMESLSTLRPDSLQNLLQLCHSEKAKRLLLYFGEIQGHPWRKEIKIKDIKMSNSLLKIVPKHGKYNSKYTISLPKEYVIQNESEIKY